MKLYVVQLQDTDDGAVAIGEVYTDEAKARARYESLKDDVGIKVLHWGAHIDLSDHDADVALKAIADDTARSEADIREGVRRQVEAIKREERDRIKGILLRPEFARHQDVALAIVKRMDER